MPAQSAAPIADAARNPQRAGDRRRDGGKAGNELCDDEGLEAPAHEFRFGLADAGPGVDRDPAEPCEHLVPVASPDQIPRRIRDDRARGRGEQGERELRAPAGNASREQQRRDSGNG